MARQSLLCPTVRVVVICLAFSFLFERTDLVPFVRANIITRDISEVDGSLVDIHQRDMRDDRGDIESIRPTPNFTASKWVDPEALISTADETAHATRVPPRPSPSRKPSNPTRIPPRPSPSRKPGNPTRIPPRLSLSRRPFNITRIPPRASLSRNPLNPSRFPNMPSPPTKNPFNPSRFPNMPSPPTRNPFNPTLRPPRRSLSKKPPKPTPTFKQPKRSPSPTRQAPQLIRMALKETAASFNRDEFIRHVSQASKVPHNQIVVVSVSESLERLLASDNGTSPNSRILVSFEVHASKSQSSKAAANNVMKAVEKGHPDLVNINLIHAQLNNSDPVTYEPDYDYDEDDDDDDDGDDDDGDDTYTKYIMIATAVGGALIIVSLIFFVYRRKHRNTKESILDIEAKGEQEAQQQESEDAGNATVEMHEL